VAWRGVHILMQGVQLVWQSSQGLMDRRWTAALSD
jgi:hypothetical protein